MRTVFFLVHQLLFLCSAEVTESEQNKGYHHNQDYHATWESLDARPLPQWYPDAKIGFFVHWGVFSVPAFKSEWFWKYWESEKDDDTKGENGVYNDFVKLTESSRFAYPDYAHRFDASFYDPDFWTEIFARAGAQYVVLTSKHHEGYCMWDSRNVTSTWNWNVMDIGPRRDVLGDLVTSIRHRQSPHTGKTLKFGAYHSLYEWFNPMWLHDKANNFTTSTFVDQKTLPELYDLVQKYEIEIIWSDGEWEAEPEYWKAKEFLAWLATNSTVKETVVWNDRWGHGTRCQHGSFWNCDDRYQPNSLTNHYFESCITLDKSSWGMNRLASADDYLTTKELLLLLVRTISRNGNLLINVGPSSDGTISPIMVERLLDMGSWLSVNKEAVYATKPWKTCDEREHNSDIFYTKSRTDNTLYIFVTRWQNNISLTCINDLKGIKSQTDGMKLRLLGINEPEYHPTIRRDNDNEQLWIIDMPHLTPDVIPCSHIWTIAIDFVSNLPETSNQ